MKIIRRETVFEGNYLMVVKKYFEGKGKGAWEVVERKGTYGKGAVVVVALTKEREVILERNWRVPLESFVIQFPAGLLDRKGETEEEAARRELLEETGYKAGKLIPIVSVPLCPALTSTQATHFFAPEVEYIGGEEKDIAEEIEVLKLPVAKLGNFLLNLPENTKLDLRVVGILWVLEREKLI